METLVGIINRPNTNPRDLRYKQLEVDSRAAISIAAGPPNSRNVRKMTASEKLIANPDLGRARLMRGARKTKTAATRTKRQLRMGNVREAAAKTRHIAPRAIETLFA